MEREEQARRERETMMKRLYDASLSGSLSSLIELIEEDQLILDRDFMITHFNETPLHIAAMLGHVEFAREILRRKPELATELDSESSSPLHLASTKGNLEMVKELLRINPDVCCITDHDGRTPLHLAAIKGRIDVMKELIQARPKVIHVRVFDRGESILHLCVKYNRLESLKLILESATDQELELLNSKDDDGNTALHLAAAKKQTKGIELLLAKNGVEVNALNESGLTALDILAQSPRDMKDMDIGESLRALGALRARDIGGATITRPNTLTMTHTCKESPHDKYDWLERKKNSLMVVSTVIATMSFQAVLSPPRGLWQDDNNNHKAGTSILADDQFGVYTGFLVVNTLSFLGSLSITFLLISGLPLKRRFFMWILLISMWVVITSLVSIYIISMLEVTPDGQFGILTNCTVIIWLGMVSLVLLVHTGRWFLKSVNVLPLLLRVGVWTFTLAITIGSIVEFSKYFYFWGMKILLYIFCIWCGMVVPILLLYTARFVKKSWKVLVKMAGCLRAMRNDENQSIV
ncbi:ankyrin repeat-containing protein BDA1-like [Macadamia integrifolia]|uniref:ankyrin repeat-containing protein BDA1-like n=1 Tax=Macadamia integrifolia TaxID=60698 RepID=UPI001C530088|nr:ankyrin repeat-containing protein BDA1-like [Macadamia integrifolia]